MNVYDFDKTIYDGDSSVDFYKFSIKRHPKLARLWVKQVMAALKYKLGKQSKTEMKTTIYEYFKKIPDLKSEVTAFWLENDHKIQSWYLNQYEHDDLIISASPEFLLKPICDQLGVALLASVVDPKTGRNMKENCYGSEKVVRFLNKYPDHKINKFYSDSYSDDPLAQLAQESYMVKGTEITPW